MNLADTERLPKLTLITAAAGFGKTTFMTQIYSLLKEKSIPAGWYTIDEYDCHEVMFLQYIIAACRSTDIIKGHEAQGLLESSQANRANAVIGTLINEIAGHNAQIIVFLDDYHLVENEKINAITERIINFSPPNMHFFLASRTTPGLSLASLRARNEICQITDRELRFTNKDIAQIVNKMYGRDLKEDHIDTLYDRTEGWAAGIHLLLLVHHKENNDDALRNVSGNIKHISDYLATNVFEQQSKIMQDFLLKISILQRVNSKISEVLTGKKNSQELLLEIEDKNLFISPLDGEREWYGFHRLFREFLQKQLRKQGEEEYLRLNDLASKWFADNGSVAEAVLYAGTAQNYDYLAELIESHALRYISGGHLPIVLDWLKKVPAHIAKQRPQIELYRCWILVHMGCVAEAESALFRAEEVISKLQSVNDVTAGSLKSLREEAGVLRVVLNAVNQNLEQIRDLEPSCDLSMYSGINAFHQGVMANTYGYMLFLLGKFGSARKMFARSRVLYQWAGSPYGLFFSEYGSGAAELEAGNLHAAEAHFIDANELAVVNSIPHVPALAIAKMYRGIVLYEWNRLEEATSLIGDNITYAKETVVSEAPIKGLLIHARICRDNQDESALFAGLDEARTICRTRHLTQLYLLVEYESICHMLFAGRISQAIATAGLLGIRLEKNRVDDINSLRIQHCNYLPFFIEARLLIALDEYGAACGYLDALAKRLLASNYRSRAIEALILHSLSCFREGDEEYALSSMFDALELGKTENYIRIFLDEGDEVIKIIRLLLQKGGDLSKKSKLDSVNYIKRILDNFTQENCGTDSIWTNDHFKMSALKEELSQRELEVLMLISKGCKNSDIATKLHISETTVKWHASNIFEKLGVKNRTAAAMFVKDFKLVK